MKLKFRPINLKSGRPIAFLNEILAKKYGFYNGERVEVFFKGKKLIIPANMAVNLVKEGEISFSEEAVDYFDIRNGEEVELSIAAKSPSTRFILKKLDNHTLSKGEIFSIIGDIVNNALNEAEIAYFVSAVYENGMTEKETVWLTDAVASTGKKLSWGNKQIVDKHSIGGVPGNRTTPIVVSICAASGLIIPKTSSRAITSAAGTADAVESVANVELNEKKLIATVEKTGACLAWGGSLGLAPADDKLIRVERFLNVDPEPQLIASILAKKISVGSKIVLLDIPYGKSAKVSLQEALHLKKKFIKIAKHFNIKLEVILTDGSQPIGNGVGPILEILDVYKILRRDNPPIDLEKKSLFLAGRLLEISGKAKKGTGEKIALEILDSGKALEKFEEIINIQGRKKTILKPARYFYNLLASKNLKIKNIDCRLINRLAQILGCPASKSSGIYIHKHCKEKVPKKERILTLYSESKKLLNEGIKFLRDSKPVITD